MKPCLFCGRRESSNEHIIAASVWKRMQAGDSTISVGIWDGIIEKDFRNPHRQESYKTRHVCGDCNTGWMSQLEAEFLELAGSLIEPTWPISAEELIEKALSQSAVLARWAVKTAITVNAAGINKRPINPQIATDVRVNKLPPELKILIAFIKTKDIAITIHPGFFFVNKKGECKWRVGDKGHSFDAIFQLNHLAIRAFNGPGLRFLHKTDTEAAPIPCYPATNHRFSPDYRFQTLSEFEGELRVMWPHDAEPG